MAMKRKHRRLTLLLVSLGGLAVAAFLVLNAFEDSLLYFKSPSELASEPIEPGKRFRLGGLVEDGTVERAGAALRFRVADNGEATPVPVTYTGIVPDLFRPGQGVIAIGALDDNGTFVATEILAKHDETYMPKEVADALKASGEWKGSAPK
jgi:cytochrome c-type biogenesis protein CcmE